MSLKYRVNYKSESRNTFEAIDSLHECHLVNAYVKACEGRGDADSETLTALATEIRSQGLATAYKGGAPILRVVADVRVVADHDYNERFLAEIEDVCRKFARPYRDGRMQAVVNVESAGFVNAYDSPAPTLKVALPKVKAVKALVGAAS
jgi:hypothetical protein